MGYQIALRIGDGVVEWVWFRSSFCAKQVPHKSRAPARGRPVSIAGKEGTIKNMNGCLHRRSKTRPRNQTHLLHQRLLTFPRS